MVYIRTQKTQCTSKPSQSNVQDLRAGFSGTILLVNRSLLRVIPWSTSQRPILEFFLGFNKDRAVRSSHHRCFIQKSCSKKFRNIHRKTPVLESVFNKALCKNKRLRHRSFPVNNVKFLRTPIDKNICEGLLSEQQLEIA